MRAPCSPAPVEEAVGRPLENVLAPGLRRPRWRDRGAPGWRTIDLRAQADRTASAMTCSRTARATRSSWSSSRSRRMRPASGDALYGEVRGLVETFQRLPGIEQMSRSAAEVVRRITGFDRVLVYRFEDNWNGVVLAEDRNDVLPSYTGPALPGLGHSEPGAGALPGATACARSPMRPMRPCRSWRRRNSARPAAGPELLGAAQRLAGASGIHAQHGHGGLHVDLRSWSTAGSGA